ncbi:Scr1 family TA system antitoxin-like transcriptional regulator [Nonomuraea sp. NPDC023979]|uniref:helix-turn-helix domain-containing protein n=1 Tax=Nonomuraea sp. NPDC023979 TaxID=3154796 RepID=UPI003404D8C9
MANLADRLTLAMSRRGCTATQLAAAVTEAGIPITRAYVSQLKSGKQVNPTLAVVRAIATYLEVSVGWLIGEESLPNQLGPALGLPATAELAESLSPESMTALKIVYELALRADQPPSLLSPPPMPAHPASLTPSQRATLAARLRALRQTAGLSPQQVRQALTSSRVPTDLSVEDLETGQSAIPTVVVEQLLTVYGVQDFHQRERVLSLARAERDPDDFDHPGVPLPYAAVRGLQQQAVLLRTYHGQQIPALLQANHLSPAVGSTSSLAADGVQSWTHHIPDMLERPDPPRLWAIVDEGALLRRPNDSRTQLAQLDYVLQVAKRPSVTVQVLPLDAPVAVPTTGPFTLLRFAEPFAPDIVHEHSIIGDRLLSDPAHVDAYNVAFAHLSVICATRGESLQLLNAHRQRISNMLT